MSTRHSGTKFSPTPTEKIRTTLEILFGTGAVVELRAFKERTIASGYFDDHEELARAALELEARGFSLYVVLNPVRPALLARAHNRVIYRPKATTSDQDIERRTTLLIDVDPVRPSGVSSTAQEKKAAGLRAREIRDYLRNEGFPEPVVADSGNGYHLDYPIYLPNDRESTALIEACLEALAFKFSDEVVSVDTSVANASRLVKLYGTTARKGDNTRERPHRVSKLVKVPDSLEAVTRDKLEAVAEGNPISQQGRRPGPNHKGDQEFNLGVWIEDHGVRVKRAGPWQGGKRWVIEECPWNGHTDNSAYIVQFANGAIAAGCHHNRCQGYGWRELREHFEPGCYERDDSHADSYGGREDEREDPVPLPSGLPEVQPFEADMLPMAVRPWLQDTAERMQVPLDYAAAAAVTVLASLIGPKIGIHPKRYDDWTVVPNVWGAIVGRPGVLKSPALLAIMKPLERLIAQSRENHEEAVAHHEIETALFDVEQEKLKGELRQAAKDDDRAKLEEIAQKKRQAQPPEEPTPKRYRTTDPTVEKLCELLVENPQGILVFRDELSGWLRNLDKHGREGDRSFYLEGWGGAGSFEVDRIGRGSLYIPRVTLTVLGGIQPGPLSRYVYAAIRGDQGDDGLLQRFQLAVWPDLPKIWRNVDRWPDQDAKNRAYEIFEKLDDLQAEGFGLTSEEPGEIPAARFTSEAQKEFDDWRSDLEARLRSGELSDPLEGHLSKFRSLMPSLALIFQLVAFVDGEGSEEAGVVSIQAARMAIRWCEYLETHATRLYASAESPAMEGARALLERIRKGDVSDGASTRSVYRKHWTKLSTPEEVNGACGVLEEFGWLRIEVIRTGGRSATRLRLHPSLREQT